MFTPRASFLSVVNSMILKVSKSLCGFDQKILFISWGQTWRGKNASPFITWNKSSLLSITSVLVRKRRHCKMGLKKETWYRWYYCLAGCFHRFFFCLAIELYRVSFDVKRIVNFSVTPKLKIIPALLLYVHDFKLSLPRRIVENGVFLF